MKQLFLCLCLIIMCGLCAFAEEYEYFESINVINNDIIEARKTLIDKQIDIKSKQYKGYNIKNGSLYRISYIVTDEKYDIENKQYYLKISLSFNEIKDDFLEYINLNNADTENKVNISRDNSIVEQEFDVENGVLKLYYGNRRILDLSDIKDKTGNNITITEIGESAFSRSDIEKIILPNSLVKIDNLAFANCKNLKTIISEDEKLSAETNNKLPDSIKQMGEYCFWNCLNLEQVQLPNSLKEISEGCFLNCRSLLEISIPDSVVEIGKNAFYDNLSLNEINIGSGVEIIKQNAFGCGKEVNKRLKDLNIPKNVIIIENEAFSGFSVLEHIKFEEGIEKIGDFAFSNAFYSNDKMLYIEFPISLKYLGLGAFQGFSSLKECKISKDTKINNPFDNNVKIINR